MIMIADDYADIGRRLNALEGRTVEDQAVISPAASTATQPDYFRAQYQKAARELYRLGYIR